MPPSPHILMCPPDYYGIHYEINPWMSRQRQVDHDLAASQWQALRDLLEAADAALVASGTATLEAALLGTPMVVVYRVNRLTYEIGRRLIQVPFISLANLVAGYGLVTERIQDEVSPHLLAKDVLALLTERERMEQMRGGFAAIRAQLSDPERQAVEVISEFLGEPSDTKGS